MSAQAINLVAEDAIDLTSPLLHQPTGTCTSTYTHSIHTDRNEGDDDVFTNVETITFTSYEVFDESFDASSDLTEDDRYDTIMEIICDADEDNYHAQSVNVVDLSTGNTTSQSQSNRHPIITPVSKSQSDNNSDRDSDTLHSSLEFTIDTMEEYHNKLVHAKDIENKRQWRLLVQKYDNVNIISDQNEIEVNYDDDLGDEIYYTSTCNNHSHVVVIDRYSMQKLTAHYKIASCDLSVDSVNDHKTSNQLPEHTPCSNDDIDRPMDIELQALPLIDDDEETSCNDESTMESDRYAIHRSSLINDGSVDDEQDKDDSIDCRTDNEVEYRSMLELRKDLNPNISPPEPNCSDNDPPDIAESDVEDDSTISSYTLNKFLW